MPSNRYLYPTQRHKREKLVKAGNGRAMNKLKKFTYASIISNLRADEVNQ